MSNLPSVGQYIQAAPNGVGYPQSEATLQAIGQSINYVLDQTAGLQNQVTSNLAAVNGHVSTIGSNSFMIESLALNNYVMAPSQIISFTSGQTFHGWFSVSIGQSGGTVGRVQIYIGSYLVFDSDPYVAHGFGMGFYLPVTAYYGFDIQTFIGAGSAVTIDGVRYATQAVST